MKKESLWISCPICDSKTRVKVLEDTVLINFPFSARGAKKKP